MSQISAAFAAVCALAVHDGHKNLTGRPGCWERQVDAHWWVAFNPHRQVTECSRDRQQLPPLSVLIEHDNFPVGIVGPEGGIIIRPTRDASPSDAERAFLNAVIGVIGAAKALEYGLIQTEGRA
ncbi:MAG: hypothetical protein LDL39_13835 [Magnetospirillum sp.]|nr:hypothetical protein [Magnetospirillum sp.]